MDEGRVRQSHRKSELRVVLAPIIETAFEQMRETEMKLQMLQLKAATLQDENDLLKYLVRV